MAAEVIRLDEWNEYNDLSDNWLLLYYAAAHDTVVNPPSNFTEKDLATSRRHLHLMRLELHRRGLTSPDVSEEGDNNTPPPAC